MQGLALLYFLLVVCCGLGLFVLNLSQLDLSPIVVYVIWTILVFVTDLRSVPFYGSSITVSCTLMVAAYILFDIPAAVCTAAIGTFLSDVIARRGAHKALFNASQSALSIYLAGIVYYVLKASSPEIVFDLRYDFVAVVLSYLTYSSVNTLLVLTIVTLSTGRKFTGIVQKNLSIEPIHLPTVLPIALLIVYLYQEEPFTLVFLSIPLMMAQQSFKNYVQLHTQTVETLQVLADIVDRRDPYTASHSQRVAVLAENLANALELKNDIVEQIAMAGRVHDIGKVSIPDRILLKSGQLTEDEYRVMMSHARAGYDILSGLQLYKKCAHYVLYHHEHFDGGGYPEGLSGEAIPIGARILAVADAYDAMTSDRPYRTALSREEALDELRRCSGRQFDPNIVEAFCALHQKTTSEPE